MAIELPYFGKLPMVQTREICTREIGSVKKKSYTTLCTYSQCSQKHIFLHFLSDPTRMLIVAYNCIEMSEEHLFEV